MGDPVDLLDVLDKASRTDVRGARRMLSAALNDDDAPARHAHYLAISAWVEYLDSRYTAAVIVAERAVTVARAEGDPEALLYALAMRLLASAGTPWAGTDIEIDHFAAAWDQRGTLETLEPESRMIAGHLLVEAVLSSGRPAEAAELLDSLADVRSSRTAENEARHPYLPFMALQWARVRVFQGRILDALPITQSVIDNCRRRGDTMWASLAEVYLAFISAHQGDVATTRTYVKRLISEFPPRPGYLISSVYAVCAYALMVIGDLDWAAELAEIGGGDSDLSNLQVADRGLAFELLVSAALQRGDIASAEAWGARSISIAAHPAAGGVVEQLLARIDLARGGALSSAEEASVSAARSRLMGRYLDAARSDLLRARALAEAGLRNSAIEQLTELAHSAHRDGLHSYGRAATLELRRLGRRLPLMRGAGWSALSERERQVAVLAAEGFSNRVIGETLFLSSRTVQSHVSRVLAALAVTSRSALPTHVQGRLGKPHDDMPELTPRQWQVARLIAQGASNRAIAEELSISVKTVEKHVSEILSRWMITSRTAIARFLVSSQ